uniref:Putative secreted protein n=1 Tax=Ixodes ricinus TaxID=34613 RepID=A0A6B0U4A8_IXORI
MARSLHCPLIIVTFLHLRHKVLISFPHDNSQLSLVEAHIKRTFQVTINSTASILQFHAQKCLQALVSMTGYMYPP